MDGSIVLGSGQRKRLLEIYRGSGGKELHHPQVRLRAHVILLLSGGHPWSLVEQVLFCSAATIARWKGRFEAGGVDALPVGWALVLVSWVKQLTPRDFGHRRSRWCCATLALVLPDTHKVKVSGETVRRCLHGQGLVWRRPRPVLGLHDPRRAGKLRKIREWLRDSPEDEAAVSQDEVDLNLNPDVGRMWTERGKRAEVVTPGDNVERYPSGSMSWRTGELVATPGTRRNAELFVAHPGDLRRRFRRYRVIHVTCDNARFHTVKGSKLVRRYLAGHGERIALHYLPARSPQDNPIGRAWWHPHEQITRNRRCASIEELVKLTMAWPDEHGAFKIEGRMYERLKAVA